MTRIALTESRIKKAPVIGNLYSLKDTIIFGLQVNINPNGKKVYFFRGFQISKKIGEATIMSLQEAREIARKWRYECISGIDISAPKKKEKPAQKEMTVNDLIKKYFEFKSSGKGCFSLRTLRSYGYVWQKCAQEGIGLLPVSELTDVMLNELFESLKETYSNVSNLKKIIVPAFNYGASMGYPVATLNPDKWLMFRSEKKERYFTPAELKKLNDIVDNYAAKNPPQQQSAIIKILMYTGCRVSEILELKWSDVHLEDGYIQLWRTKTKKGRTVPLTPDLLDLFHRIPKRAGMQYVFPSLRNQGVAYSYNTLLDFWKFFMEEGKFNADDIEKLTIHSLRHTFVTVGNRIKVSPFTLQALVGHSTGRSVTAGYIHHNLAELAEAQQSIISALKNGAY